LGLCLCLLLACVGCQSRSQAQNLADAQAGADTIGAGLGQPDAGVVARGVSSYVQAVTIEDGTALPPFGMTVAEIAANPTEYARRAKASKDKAASGGWWSALLSPLGAVGAGIVALLAGRFLPGPAGEAVANVAWAVLAPKKTKDEEAKRDVSARAYEDELHRLVSLRAATIEAERTGGACAAAAMARPEGQGYFRLPPSNNDPDLQGYFRLPPGGNDPDLLGQPGGGHAIIMPTPSGVKP